MSALSRGNEEEGTKANGIGMSAHVRTLKRECRRGYEQLKYRQAEE